jgi:hypothetical protein
MKRIFTLFALSLFISVGVLGQQTKTANLVTNEVIGGSTSVWDQPLASKLTFADANYVSTVPFPSSGHFNTTGEYSDYIALANFGFTIPNNATIQAITVFITRKSRVEAGAAISDAHVFLLSAGSTIGNDEANTSGIWPTTNGNTFYDGGLGGDPLWGHAWTPAEINDPSFGVTFSVQVLNGLGGVTDYFADIDRVRIQVEFLVPTPIILTNFDVKNNNNKVDITFATESEYKVKTLFIERSSDGKNYTDLFAIEPKGNINTRQNYHLTDAAPLLGTNYYRLKEIDIDGKWHYYETRVIKMSNVSAKFQAYQNNDKVVVNFNNQPGNYTLSLIDMNGSIVTTQNFRVDKQAVQLTVNPPVKRTGIYLVNLKGEDNFNETLKLFIQR